MKPIYFDSAATTPVMNSVIEKMTPYFSKLFGKPVGSLFFGVIFTKSNR